MEANLAQDPLRLLVSARAADDAPIQDAIQHGVGVGQRVGRWCVRGDVQLSGSWSHTLLITAREEAPSGLSGTWLQGPVWGLSRGLGAWRQGRLPWRLVMLAVMKPSNPPPPPGKAPLNH